MSNNRKKRHLTASKEPAKPRWQRFLESSGGAALITVLIGGLLGSLITSAAQSGIKAKEFKLVAYKEYLDQEREIVLGASALIGDCISASDDLIALTGPNFDPEQYPGLENQRLAIRKTYNEYSKQWRKEYRKLSFAMRYYHHSQPKVVEAWDAVQVATTDYMNCAQGWYVNHNTATTETIRACKSEKDNVALQLDNLNVSISAARNYVWQAWEAEESLSVTSNNNVKTPLP